MTRKIDIAFTRKFIDRALFIKDILYLLVGYPHRLVTGGISVKK